jgi:hypothetical protein
VDVASEEASAAPDGVVTPLETSAEVGVLSEGVSIGAADTELRREVGFVGFNSTLISNKKVLQKKKNISFFHDMKHN